MKIDAKIASFQKELNFQIRAKFTETSLNIFRYYTSIILMIFSFL